MQHSRFNVRASIDIRGNAKDRHCPAEVKASNFSQGGAQVPHVAIYSYLGREVTGAAMVASNVEARAAEGTKAATNLAAPCQQKAANVSEIGPALSNAATHTLP